MIHNGSVWYDHTNLLLTHASIQNEDTFKAKEMRQKFKKPVVYDECRYEGNINWSWGNITGEEMVNKFWRGVVNGGFVGHGETYVMEDPVQWGISRTICYGGPRAACSEGKATKGLNS